MAQTKKQRFKQQKRAAKAPKPAPKPQPVPRAKKSPDESSGNKKGILIGAGAAVALLGAAGALFLFLTPTSATAEPKNTPVAVQTEPAVKKEPDANFYRSVLNRDYELRVDQTLAQKVFESCKNGSPVNGTGRIRGVETAVSIVCSGENLKVTNTKTNQVLTAIPAPPPSPPRPNPSPTK